MSKRKTHIYMILRMHKYIDIYVYFKEFYFIFESVS